MKDLLEFIITGIVEKPKEVKIKQASENEEEILSLTVASSDMGRVIGKNGQIIRAIRNLVRACAAQQGKKVQIILQETELKK